MAVATSPTPRTPSRHRTHGFRTHVATKLVILLSVAPLLLLIGQLISGTMWSSTSRLASRIGFGLSMVTSAASQGLLSTSNGTIDLGWYPPSQTQINNLTAVTGGKGVYGFL